MMPEGSPASFAQKRIQKKIVTPAHEPGPLIITQRVSTGVVQWILGQARDDEFL
jgi:hypothetical protein